MSSRIANALAGQGSAPPTPAAPPAPPVAELGAGGTPAVAPPTQPVIPPQGTPNPNPNPAEQYVKNLETQRQGEQEYDDFLYKNDPIKYRQANPRGYLTRKIHDAVAETVEAAAGRGVEHDPEYLKQKVAPLVKSLADTAEQVYTGGLDQPQGVGKTEGLRAAPLFPGEFGALDDLASVRVHEGEVPANLKSANPNLKNGLPAAPESPISFASVGGKEIPGGVERRAPGSVGRTPGTKLKQTVDTTYELGRKYGVGSEESAPAAEAPKPESKFSSVGGTAIEKRAPDSMPALGKPKK